MILVLFNIKTEASVLVSNAISFGQLARQGNTNPWTVSRRPDEFNAGGFENDLDLQERPRSALGNAIYRL
jgi:hypothetical protein